MSVLEPYPVPANATSGAEPDSMLATTSFAGAGASQWTLGTVSFAVAAAMLVAREPSAHAEAPKKGDAAAAQALFYEARSLMKEGRYAVACPKLEESLRLDYGIGTEFNLADCNEKRGLLATAWTGYLGVAAAAKAQNQAERERVARERARILEPRLPKLVIDVPSPAPADLEVTRDGVAVGSPAWGSPIPVDPGMHRVSATASGKQPWEAAVNATEGSVIHIAIPRELRGSIVAVAPPIVANDPEPAPAPARPAPPQPFPEPVVEERGSAQRTAGWIVSGLGLAGVGVGVGFGIDSLQKRNRSTDYCVDDRCTAQGVSLRDDAIKSGDVATVATAAGGAALVGGLVLILTAPRSTSRKDVPSTSLRAVPRIAADGGGLSFQGNLP